MSSNSATLIPADAAPRVRCVRIRNFKSIGSCNIELGGLTILVGRNGSGKSNFLDALRFIADSLQTSLGHALNARGGIEQVRRKSTGHPRNFMLGLTLDLPDHLLATYDFEIAARERGAFTVKVERLVVKTLGGDLLGRYLVREGVVESSHPSGLPPAAHDRLYLVLASTHPAFRPVYDAMTSMGFYNLNPEAMKELQNPDAGELLHRDGGNIAGVIARLKGDKPDILQRITEYLQHIVPGVSDVERVALGPKETFEFRQAVKGSPHPWRFHAASMSDGTLRALGALTAVTQLAERKRPVTLVGIEEPETALHPAASGALMDALREAANVTQIVVTTHSPDLLDQVETSRDTLLIVVLHEGSTSLSGPDHATLGAIRDHLYSAGELLRMDQLEPDTSKVEEQERQATLWNLEKDEP
ncbi:MAG: AAA family ATPase [Phycisphaerales bacterium]|nr:AAA family ATPase [Phycisphaerales bacterium]